jgi:hypothetical protein
MGGAALTGSPRLISGGCGSAVADPPLELAPVDDPQDQDHVLILDDVVHDPMIADPQPVKGVPRPLDRLDRLPADATGTGDIDRQLLQRLADALLGVWGQLLV